MSVETQLDHIIFSRDANVQEEIEEEIQMICDTYENVQVSGKKTHRRLVIPLASQSVPNRRVHLDVVLAPGYPYAPPDITLRIIAPKSGISPFSKNEIQNIRKDILGCIEICRASGVPLLLQVTAIVSAAIEDDPREKEERQMDIDIVDKNSNRSPSSTPVPLKAKDALKLSFLTLHLLRKCCEMKDPESVEEMNCNFEWLSRYLIKGSGIVPESALKCLPWKTDMFTGVFNEEIQKSISSAPTKEDLLKWFWETDGEAPKQQKSLKGRYQNEFIQQRLLGSGGFAPVYVCRKKIDGVLYAVKKVIMDEKRSAKVIREVQTLAAINHKNVVRYYDAWVEDGCGEDLVQFIEEEDSSASEHSSSSGGSSSRSYSSSDDSDFSGTTDDSDDASSDGTLSERGKCKVYQTLYIQMELCSARSLRHLIDESDQNGKKGLFISEKGEAVAASILRQLLNVISHTHHEHIVHRDLKPDNVLFEVEKNDNSEDVGLIRVVDFGLAREVNMVKKSASSLEFDDVKTPLEFDAFGNANLTGECGSVLYCAPEQEKGLKYNFKVDEFSIGMIALEMWLAILGKGFRDRFNIMSEVWRSGILPEWFTQRKPKMAEIIEGLININPEKRKTCEEVLATADLPGDPIEIVQALETVEKYGDRIAGRVIQEIHNNNVKKEEWPRKPPPKLRQRVSQVAQQVFFDIVQTIHIIGQLHGTVPIAFAPQMVLPTPVNQSLGAEFVVDSGGRSSVLSNLPHLSCASFLGMQDSVPDSYYQLYHKETPFVLYTTPLPRNDGVQDHYLDSLLSFYHLLTFFNFSGSVEITVSHAIWLNAVHPRQIGSRPPPEEIAKLRSRVESVEVIATEIGKISSVLSQSCKISRETQRILSEQEDALKKYCQSIFETAKLFGIPITLTLDPSFVPSESLVNRSFLTSGVLFECQIAKSPIAFACLLDNFISACCVSDVPLSAFCINVDLLELCNIGKHVKSLPRKDLVLNGIAVRRLQHSATCTASVMEASVNLWRGNIRASLCLNGESHIFNKTLKRKNMRWCLIDGKRLVNSSHNANISRNDDVSPDNICEEVRSLFSGSKIEVEFADCSQSDPIRKEAKALCDKFVSSLNRVLVFRESVREITDALVREGKEIKDTATSDKQKDKDKGNMILESFLDDHCANHTVLPLYSVKDDALAVFINYGRLKETKKAGNGKKK